MPSRPNTIFADLYLLNLFFFFFSLDRSVPLTPESDPFGWFSKYETRNADIGEDSQPRFFEEDAARNRKATNRTEITKGDKLRVLVSFKTYLFSTREGQMVGGVMVIFDEVDVLGRDEKVCLLIILVHYKYCLFYHSNYIVFINRI